MTKEQIRRYKSWKYIASFSKFKTLKKMLPLYLHRDEGDYDDKVKYLIAKELFKRI